MKYVVIGASAAGISGCRELRKHDKDAEITLISKDDKIYSRCILHHYVHGTRDLKQLEFMEDNFIETKNINWISGVAATKVDAENKKVMLEDGREVEFDKLLIATGAHTFFPPIPHLREAKNSIGFRNIDDAEIIMEEAKKDEVKHIVIMGAGLIGIDVITGLLDYGKELALVEMQNRMLSIQLDKRAASTYEDAFRERGVKQYYEKGAKELLVDEEGKITGILLTSGEIIPCDLLVCCAGVRSNMEFLEGSGIECDRFGVIIDETGKTNIDDIYAAGDVTGRTPIWPIATKQGLIAANNMTGIESNIMNYFDSKFFTSTSTMNFLGIPTMSLGINTPPDDTYEVTTYDDGVNYKKVIHKDGIIEGAILQGDISYGGVLNQLIARKIDTRRIKKPIYSIDYSDFFNEDEKYRFSYSE
ncbi:MAG: FAD-dependent oxidoreductase [Clostridium sp.]|uniref:NAD(P)/FAD-dependent oxidoreductase n=1 Tax=Clostridium sp. DSM 8431 TaxID=1761781 RepID=UPI0008DFEC27|nr:FAD-dependent oxidoreductase [Clostridium sp. DSM 8431]MCR4943477.1 FAD-dependent oxidoreductase [Clostridium sp.]SFU57382.1 NAD(P)H-dependent nitrate reductase diaphorase subunit [Clostridium sp. DSM 8431]